MLQYACAYVLDESTVRCRSQRRLGHGLSPSVNHALSHCLSYCVMHALSHCFSCCVSHVLSHAPFVVAQALVVHVAMAHASMLHGACRCGTHIHVRTLCVVVQAFCEARAVCCMVHIAAAHKSMSHAVVQAFCEAHAAGTAVCCAADDTFASSWCTQATAAADPNFEAICDATSASFGAGNYHLDGHTGAVTPASPNNWAGFQEPAAFCDVLGAPQRTWLAHNLAVAGATVNLVVAPGGLLGNPARADGGCSGSEWDCYRPAQVQLLHTLANATGCTIVLSGACHEPMKWCTAMSSQGPASPISLTSAPTTRAPTTRAQVHVRDSALPQLSTRSATIVLYCFLERCGSDLPTFSSVLFPACFTSQSPGSR